MNVLLTTDPRPLDADAIQRVLEESTIIDKIEFSGFTRERVRTKLEDLRTHQVPERQVLLDMDDDDVTLYWFKNWLHPDLKDWVPKQCMDFRGCSERVIKATMKKEFLKTYENGQQNFDYTMADIDAWLEEK